MRRATSAAIAIQHQRIAEFNVANPAAQLGPMQAQYVATDMARRPINQTVMPLTLENIPQNNTTRQLHHLDNQIANLDANGATRNDEYGALKVLINGAEVILQVNKASLRNLLDMPNLNLNGLPYFQPYNPVLPAGGDMADADHNARNDMNQ